MKTLFPLAALLASLALAGCSGEENPVEGDNPAAANSASAPTGAAGSGRERGATPSGDTGKPVDPAVTGGK